MKKIIRLLLVLVTVVTLTACGDKKVESLILKSGLAKTSYAINETIDTSGIVVIAKYNDDTQKEVTAEDLEITGVSTAIAGNKKLTITYKGKTIDIYYTVEAAAAEGQPSSSVTVYSVGEPSFVRSYKYNIQERDQKNKEAEFFVRNNGYKVGDDNAFQFTPDVTAMDENDNPVSVNKFIATVALKDGNDYRTITGLERKKYVAVDTNSTSFDFTEEAIGHDFKLSLYPEVLSGAQLAEVADYTVSFEFTVVDGRNVYTTADLSVLNNENVQAWESYKSAHNVPTGKVAGVILHNNLNVTLDDIPDYYKYTTADDGVVTRESLGSTEVERMEQYNNKAVLGTLKDCESIYHYELYNGESLNIHGNYFTIDARTLPVTSNYGTDGSNSQLFKFDSETGNTIVNVSNLNLLGNALNYIGEGNERELAPNNMGGLTALRFSAKEQIADEAKFTTRNVNFNVDNVIAKGFFMTTLTEYPNAEYKFSNVKSFDTYGNSTFVDLQSQVKLENCQFNRSGGPLFVTQYTWNPDFADVEGIDDYLKLDIDSATIENGTASTLYGLESWFAAYAKTDLYNMVRGYNKIFEQYGRKGYVSKDNNNNAYVDVVVAMSFFNKETDDVTSYGKAVVTIDGKKVVDTVNADSTNPNYAHIIAAYQTKIPGVAPKGVPLFVNSEGDYAYFLPMTEEYSKETWILTKDISGLATNDITPITDPTDGLFTRGEYITIYYGGMAFVLKYDTTAIA